MKVNKYTAKLTLQELEGDGQKNQTTNLTQSEKEELIERSLSEEELVRRVAKWLNTSATFTSQKSSKPFKWHGWKSSINSGLAQLIDKIIVTRLCNR